MQKLKSHKHSLLIIIWTLIVYSFISHKEFRFLLPLMPFINIICGNYLSKQISKFKLNIYRVVLMLNIPLILYLGLFHQRGSLDVMEYLHHNLVPGSKVLFLTPCHSTPLYSHLHRNISTRFLTCEPNLHGQSNYIDEADVFYKSPHVWLDNEYPTTFPYTHVVMYNVLYPEVSVL